MTRTILVYGALSGTTVICGMILGMTILESGGFSEALGYLIMVAALVLIFLGIKRFRDRDQGGVITFGRATLVGLGIAAVAGVMYVVIWEANLAITDYAFMEEYSAAAIAEKEAEGVSEEELAAFRTEMAAMQENYANPLFRIPITFLEIFPVGLIITLISAALLRRPSFMPARA